jgi:hypothetical protein
VRGITKLAPGPGNVGLAERDEPPPWPGEALLEVVPEVVPLDAWERVFDDLRTGRGVKYVFDPRL